MNYELVLLNKSLDFEATYLQINSSNLTSSRIRMQILIRLEPCMFFSDTHGVCNFKTSSIVVLPSSGQVAVYKAQNFLACFAVDSGTDRVRHCVIKCIAPVR